MSTIYWLRNDLRLHDNECLHRAVERDKPLTLVYVFDVRQFEMMNIGFRKTGYIRYKFLCDTLQNLRENLAKRGAKLLIRVGKPEEVLADLIDRTKADLLLFQEEVTSEELAVEKAVTAAAEKKKCEVRPVWGLTMYHVDDAPFDPKETPLTSKAFRINLSKKAEVRPLFVTPEDIPAPPESLTDFGDMPTAEELGFTEEEIDSNTEPAYPGGETYALERLDYYTTESQLLTNYKWTRNRSLGDDFSSKFSPYMALGSLSPRKIYWQVKDYEKAIKKNISTWWLVFEVVWRDFFKYTAIRFGNKIFAEGGIKNRETDWSYDKDLFDRWRFGKTGIPFIDAHIRQLNATGFMSNRGRVNCASFLTRDYKIDWRWGAAWFETQLIDYDVCSNWLNWNTQALEIYYTNPVHQGGNKYDKNGEYVKAWLPELAEVPAPLVHAPWMMTETEKKQYPTGDYPEPVEVYKKWSRASNLIRRTVDG